MRLSRVDVNASADAAGEPIFVERRARRRSCCRRTARGASSSTTRAPARCRRSMRRRPCRSSGAASSNSATRTTDAARRRSVAPGQSRSTWCDRSRPARRNYGLLQSTGTQKALFRLPSFQQGVDQLLGATPDFADAYRLVNSTGIFPNVQDALPLNLGALQDADPRRRATSLLDQADPDKVFEQLLPPGPLYLINEDVPEDLRRVRQEGQERRHAPATGMLRFGFDSGAADLARSGSRRSTTSAWSSTSARSARLMMIKGKFDAEKGSEPGVHRAGARVQRRAAAGDRHPADPADALRAATTRRRCRRASTIAMSNSADSWNYAFHARKEIPVVKFPPGSSTTRRRIRSSSRPTSRSACTSTRRWRSPSDAGPADPVGRRVPRVRRQPVGDVREPGRGHGLRHRLGRPPHLGRHQDRARAAHEVRLRRRDRRRPAGGRRRVAALHGGRRDRPRHRARSPSPASCCSAAAPSSSAASSPCTIQIEAKGSCEAQRSGRNAPT